MSCISFISYSIMRNKCLFIIIILGRLSRPRKWSKSKFLNIMNRVNPKCKKLWKKSVLAYWVIFLDIIEGQTPEHYVLFKILFTLYTKKMRYIIQSARKNRSIANKSKKKDSIEVHLGIKDKILRMISMKVYWIMQVIASKGKYCHLLKNEAKFRYEKSTAKKYYAELKKNVIKIRKKKWKWDELVIRFIMRLFYLAQ